MADGLALVAGLQLLLGVLDPPQVGEQVPDSGGAEGRLQLPPSVRLEPLAVHLDGEVARGRGEDVLRLRVVGQRLTRRGGQDPPGALVAHLHQGPDAQLQRHRLLVAGEVAHILQDEVLGPVILAVGQVG